LAFAFQINIKDPVPEIDPRVANESIPNGGQARVLFCGIWTFEVFINHGANWVDR